MTNNKEKQFDCIKMKNSIQTQIYSETANMTKTELLNYYNKDSKNNKYAAFTSNKSKIPATAL